MHNLTRSQRRTLWRILLAAALLVGIKLLPTIYLSGPLPLLTGPETAEGFPLLLWPVYLIPYAVIGLDVLGEAVGGICRGQVFDENFLMALATVGAFFTGEYAEAVFVMLFYQVGELFQDYAVTRSRQSIAALMDIRPDTALVEGPDGTVTECDPEDVAVGDVIVVRPGQRVALDGVVLTGTSTLDTAALTGESVPRNAGEGDEVLSGFVNQSGTLRLRVTKPCSESTVSRILDLVEEASEKKAMSEAFITRFARYYTPCVVGFAGLLFLLPTLALSLLPMEALPAFLSGTDWADWMHRALIFLVVSCPCALVISVPLSFFGGIGGASRLGILVKGGNYLEALARTETVVFDKTGTLTRGVFTVTDVRPAPGFTKETLLEMAALAEQDSSHPIAASLRRAWGKPADPVRVTACREKAGLGLEAQVDGHTVLAGSRRLLTQSGILPTEEAPGGTVVYAAVDGVYAGSIVISDLPKEEAADAIAQLKAAGVKRVVMLTGDAEAAARAAAEQLGVDEFHAGLLPGDKVAKVEELLALRSANGKLAFVGDGINDAPVLSRADIGIAMGAMGSDAAIEAADVVLMDDQLTKLPMAIRIARRTVVIVRQNIVLALAVKGAVLLLGAVGHATMWEAVFADVGVAFLAILNAMRCLHLEKPRPNP